MFANQAHEQAVEQSRKGNHLTALELFDQALTAAPDHPDILSDRGVCKFHLKDIDGAFQDMNRALELEPERPYRYSSLAYLKGVTGDVDGAIADYQKCVDLDPEDAIALNNLGLMLEKKGIPEEAKAYFERADRIAKLEKGFQERMSELHQEEMGSKEDIPQEEEPTSLGKEMRKALTTKDGRKEFWRYIRNGFKIK